MLRLLGNRKIAKRIWIVLAIIVIPAFCFWGFGGVLGEKQDNFAGKAFGKKISRQEYRQNLKALRHLYLMQLGEEQLKKIEKNLNLEAQTWDRIILLYEAKRKKIKVGDKEVIGTISRYPFFQEDGKFSPGLYEKVLQYVFGVRPREFEEEVRDNIMINKLYQELAKDIDINEGELRQASNEENEPLKQQLLIKMWQEKFTHFLNELRAEAHLTVTQK